VIINPLSDEHPNKVMNMAIAVRKLSDNPEVANLAAVIVFLLGNVDLARQEFPESQYAYDSFLEALRAATADIYPEMIAHYFAKCSSGEDEREELAQVIQFPETKI